MTDMKFGACTILYNPDEIVIQNILSYSFLVDVCVVVDNSDIENEVINSIKKLQNVHYISMNGNKGIAAALNRGIEYIHKKSVDYVITLDQDSRIPSDKYKEMVSLIDEYKRNYSILCLNFNNRVFEDKDVIINVDYWITSGNIINIKDFYEIGRFNEDLFIDYVDYDFCHKIVKSGKRIGVLKDYSIEHRIGNPITFSLFGKTFYTMNHAPIRYYYRYRNCVYLYKTDRKFFKKLLFKELFVNYFEMLLLENDKIKKSKMIIKGIIDANRGKLGQVERRV